MQIPFIGGAYKGRSRELNSQECVNWYPVMDQTGAKNIIALFGTPGLVEFYDPSNTNEVRGICDMGDYLYAVIGNTVYEVDINGSGTALSGNLSEVSGPVWMVENGTYLMIVEPGVEGYHVQQGGTVTAIADADFPTPRGLEFVDGYFMITKDATKDWYISALNDPTAWTSTDYETAERKSDNLVAVRNIKGQVFLVGKKSIEVWAHTGAADWPFTYMALIKQGTAAAMSVADDESGIFYLNDRNEVAMTVGYQAVKVSTDSLDYQINTYNSVGDAVGYIYNQEGHRFYILNFPSANKTWAYDIATGLWHERRSSRADITPSQAFGRHRSNCFAKFDDKLIVGDYTNGKLYKYDMDTYTDDGNSIIRRRAVQTVHQDQKNQVFHSLEIDFEGGQGLATGQGNDPQAMLDWSDDGGFTWSNEHWTSIGAIGKYGARAKWNRLGSGRNRVFRVTITDPVKCVMINAHLRHSVGMH